MAIREVTCLTCKELRPVNAFGRCVVCLGAGALLAAWIKGRFA